MKLRPFQPDDFTVIQRWITDARTHAMWCANRMQFPLCREDFIRVIDEHSAQYGDKPLAAVSEDGAVIGFFCFSRNAGTNEGMLRFIVVDSARRGQGLGRQMLRLAVQYAFETTGADAVQLMVFSQNVRAKKCYEAAGFTERRTEAGVFRYGDELWDRCNMVIHRPLQDTTKEEE
ncbi:MAG: GNAT family N-acetyltransferase [Oscillospiraceae bacterium]|nr:GNAT family N-acetyltransferase [Oscillospiraceae bacterium]